MREGDEVLVPATLLQIVQDEVAVISVGGYTAAVSLDEIRKIPPTPTIQVD